MIEKPSRSDSNARQQHSIQTQSTYRPQKREHLGNLPEFWPTDTVDAAATKRNTVRTFSRSVILSTLLVEMKVPADRVKWNEAKREQKETEKKKEKGSLAAVDTLC